jgi:hypothetical protein
MADNSSIGKPLPRGVVDISHDFVGIPQQAMNPRLELARLQKQVALLRGRIEAQGFTEPKPLRSTTLYMARAALLSVGFLVIQILRSGRAWL